MTACETSGRPVDARRLKRLTQDGHDGEAQDIPLIIVLSTISLRPCIFRKFRYTQTSLYELLMNSLGGRHAG